jgi:hypothetical protein
MSEKSVLVRMKCAALLLSFHIAFLSRGCSGACFRPKPASSNEVGKLQKNKEPVMFQVTAQCQREITDKFLRQDGHQILQYLAVASCQISNSFSEPYRVMIHDDEEHDDIKPVGRTTDLQFRALVLLQLPNIISYMILNPKKGHWLFTNELSGCDIFIATKKSQPDMPLVVHANADKFSEPNQQVENLRWKGDKVDQILRDFQKNYVLKARIHIKPEQPIPADYDGYWDKYKTDHQGRVKVYQYDILSPVVQPFQFYAFYKKGWTFFLKGRINGVKTNIPV